MNQTLGMDPAQAVLADVELTGVGPSRRNSPAETHVEGTHLHERSLQGSAQRGCLAHFLKNRFYIGEVGYRGETHTGGHASIIDRPTFDAVQALLAQNARARQVRLNDSPAILMGRISTTAAIA